MASGALESQKRRPDERVLVRDGPVTPWVHGLAGVVGSSISMALFYPLDFFRTRMHVHKDGNRHPLRSAKEILRAEGVRGVYRGVTLAVVSYSLAWGSYLLTFRMAQQNLFPAKQETMASLTDKGDISRNVMRDFFSACVASLITGSLVTPFYFLKTRRQLHDMGKYGEPRDIVTGLKAHVKREGFLSLMRGVGPQILLTGSTTVQVTLYEELKRKTFKDSENPSFMEVAFASAVSRATASTICNPLEVVRTRLQDKRSCFLREYSSMWTAFCTIWRTEGVSGLYRGLPVNICRVIPTTVMTVVIYEKFILAALALSAMEKSFPRIEVEAVNDLDTWMGASPID